MRHSEDESPQQGEYVGLPGNLPYVQPTNSAVRKFSFRSHSSKGKKYSRSAEPFRRYSPVAAYRASDHGSAEPVSIKRLQKQRNKSRARVQKSQTHIHSGSKWTKTTHQKSTTYAGKNYCSFRGVTIGKGLSPFFIVKNELKYPKSQIGENN